MLKLFLFCAAVFVVYIGGFIYDEVGPLLYALLITIIASIPLLLKASFWKKIIFMVPLLVLRVVGKVFLTLFGKNALSKLLARYGLLEKRFHKTIESFAASKTQGLNRWNNTSRQSQAYLLLIFMPVALVIFLLTLLIKFIRFRFLQFLIEKLMQSFLMKWTLKLKPNLSDEQQKGTQKTHQKNDTGKTPE